MEMFLIILLLNLNVQRPNLASNKFASEVDESKSQIHRFIIPGFVSMFETTLVYLDACISQSST